MHSGRLCRLKSQLGCSQPTICWMRTNSPCIFHWLSCTDCNCNSMDEYLDSSHSKCYSKHRSQHHLPGTEASTSYTHIHSLLDIMNSRLLFGIAHFHSHKVSLHFQNKVLYSNCHLTKSRAGTPPRIVNR